MVLAAAMLLAFLMSGAITTAITQTPKPTPGAVPQHQKAMQGMSEMMGGPHHLLAMAYRENLATFARVLQTQSTHSDTVNLDLARPAVAEMRRSFDQMRQHHHAHMMTMMHDHTDSTMSSEMQHMEAHLTAIGEHLTLLEAVVNESAPDPKDVSDHTTQILKECDGMSTMPANHMPHQAMPAKAKPHPGK